MAEEIFIRTFMRIILLKKVWSWIVRGYFYLNFICNFYYFLFGSYRLLSPFHEFREKSS